MKQKIEELEEDVEAVVPAAVIVPNIEKSPKESHLNMILLNRRVG